MKFFRLDLLTLLISLFILSSCVKQDSIGLGVNASNQLNGSLIDTATIIINTIPEDSVLTSTSKKMPMGYIKDPVFGITEANLALDLNAPSSAAYTPPAGTITIDSAVLILKYTQGFYGDSIASKYKVNVYQLNERVFNVSYYNTKQWSYNSSNLLGTRSFISRTNDSTKLVKSVAGRSDVISKVAPQLRIPIDKNFINSILFNAPSSQLVSNLTFKNAVKGLYVTLDKAQTTGAGGVFMFNGSDLASLEVYYRSVNGSIVDTTSVTLSSSYHAAEVKHNYSTPIQTELANQSTSRNTFYLQGLAGLRAKISFPYLKKIIENLGSDIVLNRAELVITPVAGSTIPFAPIPQLSMYKYDQAHQRVALSDAVSTDPRGTQLFGGYYFINTNDYHFIITAHIEDLLRGKTVDNGTFLGAVDIADGSYGFAATATSAARTFAVGSDLTSPYRIKLNIIYTKLAK
ncbi:hypothetical protein GCM10027049_29840 [Mucilaginibacter puniceus]